MMIRNTTCWKRKGRQIALEGMRGKQLKTIMIVIMIMIMMMTMIMTMMMHASETWQDIYVTIIKPVIPRMNVEVEWGKYHHDDNTVVVFLCYTHTLVYSMKKKREKELKKKAQTQPCPCCPMICRTADVWAPITPDNALPFPFLASPGTCPTRGGGGKGSRSYAHTHQSPSRPSPRSIRSTARWINGPFLPCLFCPSRKSGSQDIGLSPWPRWYPDYLDVLPHSPQS